MFEALKHSPPVISVDVEDWAQSTWDHDLSITERAVTNTRRILDTLSESNICATMFVLGKFAKAFPHIVREIRSKGHEVACHGFAHKEIFTQSRQEFIDDVRCAKDQLEQILGERIYGYRAPDFSIVRHTLWALEDLAELGFTYDSSIFPIHHPRYGIPDWPSTPAKVLIKPNLDILEIPIAMFRFLGKHWPAGGGGYNRLLPGIVSRSIATVVMSDRPFIFYCHPYEIDHREFEESPIRVPLFTRMHQGLGRSRVEHRLRYFLQQFGGQTMQQLIASQYLTPPTAWPSLDLESFLRSDRSRVLPSG